MQATGYSQVSVGLESIARVTPRLSRLVLAGPTLLSLGIQRAGQWVKLFPSKSPTGRALTIRRWNEAAKALTIDVVMHGKRDSFLQSWLKDAKPGDQVTVAGPRSDFQIRHKDASVLLMGDEVALPAIAAFLESFPASAQGVVLVESADAAFRKLMPTHDGVATFWLNPIASRPGRALCQALKNIAGLDSDRQVWVACESRAAKEIRSHFSAHGASRSQLHISGYWKCNTAEFVDAESDY